MNPKISFEGKYEKRGTELGTLYPNIEYLKNNFSSIIEEDESSFTEKEKIVLNESSSSQKNLKREGYNQTLYAKWRTGVHILYKGHCFIPKKRYPKMECHHFNSWFQSKEERYKIANGVFLQSEVHREFHFLYGPHTTVEQFEEFALSKGRTDFPWKNQLESITKVISFLENRPSAFQEKMLSLLQKRNFVYVDGSYLTQKSVFPISCPKHDCHFQCTYVNFSRNKFACPKCILVQNSKTAKPPSQLGKIRSQESRNLRLNTVRKKCMVKIEEEAKKRSHKIVSGTFENRFSNFEILCLIHKKTQTVIYHNSMRAHYGVQCCQKCSVNSV